MTHIIYFLLLLFCISTNMIHSSEELKRPQENYSKGASLSPTLLATILPPKPTSQSSVKTELLQRSNKKRKLSIFDDRFSELEFFDSDPEYFADREELSSSSSTSASSSSTSGQSYLQTAT